MPNGINRFLINYCHSKKNELDGFTYFFTKNICLLIINTSSARDKLLYCKPLAIITEGFSVFNYSIEFFIDRNSPFFKQLCNERAIQ